MIDLTWLEQHPANRFAAAMLKKLNLPPSNNPLLELATEWLRRAKPNSLPWPDYQQELLERAELLMTDDPVWATALLMPEFETLEEEANRAPSKEAKFRLLAESMDQLLNDLKRQPTVGSVGQELAENLYSNLRLAYPAFGHQSG